MRKQTLADSGTPRLRADEKKLRKACRLALQRKEKTPAQEWLCDNAYLLRQAAADVRSAQRALPKGCRGMRRMQPLFAICTELYTHGQLLSQDSLIAALREKPIDSLQAQALPAVLRAVTVHEAAAGADDASRISKAVRTLRGLPDIDFEEVLCAVSPLEHKLREDPAGVYAEMDDASRADYRMQILRMAAKHRKHPDEAAQAVLEKANAGTDARMRHVGKYLLPAYPRRRGVFFLCLECLLPILLCLTAALWLRRVLLPLLLVLPVWGITSFFCTRLSLQGVRPRRLPRMRFEEVPKDMQTLLTVSALLPSAAGADAVEDHLEQLYLSNGGAHVRVLLLADLKNAGTPEKPEDRADLAACRRMIDRLNDRHGSGFLLAVRRRTYAPTEGVYSGWERKRGAVTQLVREICGDRGHFLLLHGDTKDLRDTRYLLLLDSDTQLPLDAAAELLRVAAHPLHHPVIDPRRGVVTAGYGVLAPRVCTEHTSQKTKFQRIFSGDCGLSMYDNVVSERYQDLFGEGIFAGKGLVDVRAFYAVLDDALPEGLVLSHDSVESGFLRCGFVSDVQVSDGFPKDQTSYLSRMRRWVRGDWQNLRFLVTQNPLRPLARFRLWDNMRRSLTSAVCMLSLFCAVFLPARDAAILTGVCLLSCCAEPFFAAVRAFCTRGFASLSRLFDSGVVPSALGMALRGAAQIMILPLQGLFCAESVCRALYRTARGRRTLEWTTFAETNARASGRRNRMQCLYVAAVAAVLFISGRALLRLAAVLFLLDIPFLLLSGREDVPQTARLTDADREKLISYAAAMWDYFAENCDFRNNYLPPDNVQETPVYRVARRTSPTNIGLALLCVLAARDFDWIDTREMCVRLQQMLGSVEQLETVHGNLLNWYDTQTLQPLQPKYLSAVDCGNFLVCLKTLQQGLQEYAPQLPALRELDARLQTIIDRADLTRLYHAKRRLFHIGMDAETGKPSASYYDLLMSEARMTGYYAIARGQAPKKHWAALSRAMTRDGRYTGPVSWTGTTFEYFMPYLFLPAGEGTLGAEALHFCLRCQKKRMRGKPFGISESGFYAFDRDLNYQYKAHGVGRLGLRRGLDTETVVSPYSSFLMMQLQPAALMRNLQRLERWQMTGRWGFYEAVDLTPSRTAGRPYAVVRSYMAHHVGMSLLAADNVLHDGVMRARFMRDTEMRRARSLLEEGVPTDAPIFKSRSVRVPPAPRERVEPQRREVENASLPDVHARVWTNGEMSLCCTDVGASETVYRGVSLFRHSTDIETDPGGPWVVLQSEGKALPFAPITAQAPKAAYRCAFCGTEMRYAAAAHDVQLRVRVRVHPDLAALQYTVSVRSGKKPFTGSLLFYAEPSLTAHREAERHPAFAKLFLEDERDPENDVYLFRKRERDGGRGVCMAAGFRVPTAHTCTRAKVAALRTGYGTDSLLTGDVQWTDMPGHGDACLALQVPVQIASRGSGEWTLFVTAASTTCEAVQRLLLLRKTGMRKGAGGLFGDGRLEEVLLERMLPAIVFGHRASESRRLLARNRLPLRTLWKFGVSGDDPVLFYALTPQQDASSALPYLRAAHRLRHAGFACDLLLGYAEESVYDQPLLHGLQDAVREVCGAPERAGGVFFVDTRTLSEAERAFLQAISVFSAETEEKSAAHAMPRRVFDGQSVDPSEKLFTFTETGVQIPKSVAAPYLPWSLALANPAFGTMVSDKALGFTWAVNAHEMKLTPWDNDPARDNRGEQLFLCADGKLYDMLRCASASFSPRSAQWSGRVGGVSYQVTVTVPERGLCKHCNVTLQSDTDTQVRLLYAMQPVLGADRRDGDFVHVEPHADGLLLTSADAPVRGAAYLAVQGGADRVYTDRNALWYKELDDPGAPYAAVEKAASLFAGQTASVLFSLSFAATETAAVRMPSLPPVKPGAKGRITVHSADPSFDRMVNTWLPWQIRACRMEGRTGFYQCGGAWGFRDQLQDASAFLLTDPEAARRQILRAAAVQFPEGDVLHWWHRLPDKENGLRGVRTRVRDDLLWLPWLTAAYVRVTGDGGVLDTLVPYLEGEPLGAQEAERYFAPRRSAKRETLRSHCLRAIDLVLQKGTHGLALIGGGDWNDGFDRVGAGGKGESVWLSMFLCMVMRDFLPYCDAETAQRYRAQTDALMRAVETCAWDGDHYLRAFMDDGTPIGQTGDAECSIDSIAQSFAVFAGFPAAHAHLAVQTAAQRLTDPQKGIVKLLDPPFSGSGKQAGYITAYPPGIRENGGQYTHAAVWLCAAYLLSGRMEEGYAMFRMLNPAYFCRDAERCSLYGGEPYAMAGDIPSAERAVGCTGWSLYTGAAAWMYRTATEILLGIRIEGEKVTFRPHLPQALLPLQVEISIRGTQISIQFREKNAKELYENGKMIECIRLDQRPHSAEFR